MGIGVSILLLAAGAILAFATSVTVSGIDLATVGIILMIVGGIGLVVSLIMFAPRRQRTAVVQERSYDEPRAAYRGHDERP